MKPDNGRKNNPTVEGLINLGHKDNCNQIHKLEYIFSMLKELRNIAKNMDETSLVYYLEMAAMEAGDTCDAMKFERDSLGEEP